MEPNTTERRTIQFYVMINGNDSYSVPLKIQDYGDLTYKELREIIDKVYGYGLMEAEQITALTYMDEEHDEVTVCCDSDFEELMKSARKAHDNNDKIILNIYTIATSRSLSATSDSDAESINSFTEVNKMDLSGTGSSLSVTSDSDVESFSEVNKMDCVDKQMASPNDPLDTNDTCDRPASPSEDFKVCMGLSMMVLEDIKELNNKIEPLVASKPIETLQQPPQWFEIYMEKFKNDILNEVNGMIQKNSVSKKNIGGGKSRNKYNHHSSHSGDKGDIQKKLESLQKKEKKIQEKIFYNKDVVKMGKLKSKMKKINEQRNQLMNSSENQCNLSEGCTVLDGVNINASRRFLTVKAGSKFVYTWTIMNSGTVKWTEGIQLNLISTSCSTGLQPASNVVSCPSLEVGQIGEIKVEFQAPKNTGHYTSSWQFSQPGYKFPSIPLVCTINVVNDIHEETAFPRQPVVEDISSEEDETSCDDNSEDFVVLPACFQLDKPLSSPIVEPKEPNVNETLSKSMDQNVPEQSTQKLEPSSSVATKVVNEPTIRKASELMKNGPGVYKNLLFTTDAANLVAKEIYVDAFGKNNSAEKQKPLKPSMSNATPAGGIKTHSTCPPPYTFTRHLDMQNNPNTYYSEETPMMQPKYYGYSQAPPFIPSSVSQKSCENKSGEQHGVCSNYPQAPIQRSCYPENNSSVVPGVPQRSRNGNLLNLLANIKSQNANMLTDLNLLDPNQMKLYDIIRACTDNITTLSSNLVDSNNKNATPSTSEMVNNEDNTPAVFTRRDTLSSLMNNIKPKSTKYPKINQTSNCQKNPQCKLKSQCSFSAGGEQHGVYSKYPQARSNPGLRKTKSQGSNQKSNSQKNPTQHKLQSGSSFSEDQHGFYSKKSTAGLPEMIDALKKKMLAKKGTSTASNQTEEATNIPSHLPESFINYMSNLKIPQSAEKKSTSSNTMDNSKSTSTTTSISSSAQTSNIKATRKTEMPPFIFDKNPFKNISQFIPSNNGTESVGAFSNKTTTSTTTEVTAASDNYLTPSSVSNTMTQSAASNNLTLSEASNNVNQSSASSDLTNMTRSSASSVSFTSSNPPVYSEPIQISDLDGLVSNLLEMGFENLEKILQVLKECNYNLEAAVSMLTLQQLE